MVCQKPLSGVPEGVGTEVMEEIRVVVVAVRRVVGTSGVGARMGVLEGVVPSWVDGVGRVVVELDDIDSEVDVDRVEVVVVTAVEEDTSVVVGVGLGGSGIGPSISVAVVELVVEAVEVLDVVARLVVMLLVLLVELNDIVVLVAVVVVTGSSE